LFHALLRLVPAMYGEEMAQTVATLARLKINNKQLLQKLGSAVIDNIGQLRFLHACQVAGSFASLGHLDQFLLSSLEGTSNREIDMMRPEELMENLRAMIDLEFSWKPFEHNLRERGLVPLISSLTGATEIDQFSAPVDFLLFAKRHSFLNNEMIIAYSKWLKEAVLRPNTRLGRRPTADDVYIVADLCWELGVAEEDALEAVNSFTNDKPEVPKPLKYMKHRKYIRAVDPVASANLSVAKWPLPRSSYPVRWEPSPGKWTKSGNGPAWRNRPVPAHYTK
jgi:ABC-type taurine transport system substrate-binding protein